MNKEIILHGLLLQLPKSLKNVLLLFVSAIIFGFSVGLMIVEETTSFSTQGVEQNYRGNEEDEETDIIVFKKSALEMTTIIHNHVLSMSMLFLIISILVLMTSAPKNLISILAIEPFISIFVSFGGIIMVWNGFLFMSYIVIVSGVIMSISVIVSLLFIIRDLIKK